MSNVKICVFLVIWGKDLKDTLIYLKSSLVDQESIFDYVSITYHSSLNEAARNLITTWALEHNIIINFFPLPSGLNSHYTGYVVSELQEIAFENARSTFVHSNGLNNSIESSNLDQLYFCLGQPGADFLVVDSKFLRTNCLDYFEVHSIFNLIGTEASGILLDIIEKNRIGATKSEMTADYYHIKSKLFHKPFPRTYFFSSRIALSNQWRTALDHLQYYREKGEEEIGLEEIRVHRDGVSYL